MVKTDEKLTMSQLVEEMGNSLIPYREGDVVEVTILEIGRNKILVDVAGLTLGMIPEREFSPEMVDFKPGDKVLAYVLSMENDEGKVVLSLKRADKERMYRILDQKYKDGEVVAVRVSKVSRGGLLVDFGGLEGFLPLSKLAFNHSPRGAKSEGEIMNKLYELLNSTLQVKIIAFDKRLNKLIFSEKDAVLQAMGDKVKNIKLDSIISGKITGIADFGLFVNLGEIDGLVHISEIAWEKVSDLHKMFKIGEIIKVKVIGIENNRVFLSLKRLLPDPWEKLAKKIKVGDIIKAQVIKITAFGIFAQIEKGVDGLCPKENIVGSSLESLKLGQEYKFKIENFDLQNHKITLSQVKEQTTKKSTPKEKKVSKTKVAPKKSGAKAKKSKK